MKTTVFLSMLGLAASALAGPLPGSEEALDSKPITPSVTGIHRDVAIVPGADNMTY